MNEELQKALGVLLNKANDGIDAASGFLASELPDVIQQLLMWHGVLNLIYCVVGIVGAFVFVCIDIKLFKLVKSLDCEESLVVGYVMFGSIPRVFICIVLHSYINVEWVQIWLAPKVWIIEYAAKLAG